MYKAAILSFLATSTYLFCAIDVSMMLAVGDEKIRSTYTVEGSASFSYRTKNTVADVWRGQLHAFERFNGEEKVHTLPASSSLFDVAKKLKRMTTSASDIVEIIGTLREEGDQIIVHISKIKRAGKIVARDKEKKAKWSEQLRFYISDEIYIEVIATPYEENEDIKRGGWRIDDDEFEDETPENAATQPEPITCTRCAQTLPATQGVTVYLR